MATAEMSAEEKARSEYKIWNVIGASAAGTVIEWYDFYIFGTLATTVAPKMYPPGNETVQLLLYLSTFAVGFVVRPFGALFFGRIGDLVGRKYAFLVTLLIMGSCTAGVGLLPGYGTIGYVAPALLILFRILQGLALGGEYGGAAIYVAEHVPDNRRGFYTSFIQITATARPVHRHLRGHPHRAVAGQRRTSPTGAGGSRSWLSILLVGISLYIRLQDEGVADLRQPQGPGEDVDEPAQGRPPRLGELEAHPHVALRRHRRPGRRLVHRPVLRPVLPADTILRLPKTEARHGHRRGASCSACRCSWSSGPCPTGSGASGS